MVDDPKSPVKRKGPIKECFILSRPASSPKPETCSTDSEDIVQQDSSSQSCQVPSSSSSPAPSTSKSEPSDTAPDTSEPVTSQTIAKPVPPAVQKQVSKSKKITTVENISTKLSLLTQLRKLPRNPVVSLDMINLNTRFTAIGDLPQYTDLVKSFITLEQKSLEDIPSSRVRCVDQLLGELIVAGFPSLEQLIIALTQIARKNPSGNLKTWRASLESLIGGLEDAAEEEEEFDIDLMVKLIVFHALPYIT